MTCCRIFFRYCPIMLQRAGQIYIPIIIIWEWLLYHALTNRMLSLYIVYIWKVKKWYLDVVFIYFCLYLHEVRNIFICLRNFIFSEIIVLLSFACFPTEFLSYWLQKLFIYDGNSLLSVVAARKFPYLSFQILLYSYLWLCSYWILLSLIVETLCILITFCL